MAIAGAAQWSMGIPSLIKQSAASVFAYRPNQLVHNPGASTRMQAMQDSLSRSAGSFMNSIPFSSCSSSSSSSSFWADQWLANTASGEAGGGADLLLFQGADIPSSYINGYSCCPSMPGLKELPTLFQEQYSPPPPPYKQDYTINEEVLIQLPPFPCQDDSVVDPGITGWLDLLLDPSSDFTSPTHPSLLPKNMIKCDYTGGGGGIISEGDTESSSCSFSKVKPVEKRKRKYDDMDNSQSVDASYPSKKPKRTKASKSTVSMIDRAEDGVKEEEEKELCAMLYRPHMANLSSLGSGITSHESTEIQGEKKPSSAVTSSSPSKLGVKKGSTATDAQSVAARTRREKISQRLKILQTMLPNGEHLDTVATLGQTFEYIRFLQHQISELFHGTDPSLTSAQYEKWKDFM